jgi:hypothetical protein
MTTDRVVEYTICGDGLRLQRTFSSWIASAVVSDLQERYPTANVKVETRTLEKRSHHLDLGGSIMASWTPASTLLRDEGDDIVFTFWPHQADELIFKITKHLGKGRRGPEGMQYIKLHGAWTTACIDVKLAEELLLALKAALPDISQKAGEMLDQFSAGLEALRGHPNLQVPEPVDPNKVN